MFKHILLIKLKSSAGLNSVVIAMVLHVHTQQKPDHGPFNSYV